MMELANKHFKMSIINIPVEFLKKLRTSLRANRKYQQGYFYGEMVIQKLKNTFLKLKLLQTKHQKRNDQWKLETTEIETQEQRKDEIKMRTSVACGKTPSDLY